MSVDDQTIEARGANVDKAVENGLAQLGLKREEVNIEILDEGSAGFLGIGSRDAVVRVSGISQPVQPPSRPPDPPAVAVEPEVVDQRPKTAVADEAQKPVSASPPLADEPEGPSEKDMALEIVSNLLEKMQVTAEVSLRMTEPDDLTGEQRPVIDITGNDLGVLIGPRGETLNSLQFIARLMTGHALRKRPYFIVDIEGYRSRREQALTRLAERMADKVVKNQRPTTLEPMPANERRIIHMALRSHPDVYTESTGEGRRRRVRVLLKN